MRTHCLLLIAVPVLALASCETIPERKAGGAAFDEAYLGERLDSNQADPEANLDARGHKTAPSSFEQWRDEGDEGQ